MCVSSWVCLGTVVGGSWLMCVCVCVCLFVCLCCLCVCCVCVWFCEWVWFGMEGEGCVFGHGCDEVLVAVVLGWGSWFWVKRRDSSRLWTVGGCNHSCAQVCRRLWARRSRLGQEVQRRDSGWPRQAGVCLPGL